MGEGSRGEGRARALRPAAWPKGVTPRLASYLAAEGIEYQVVVHPGPFDPVALSTALDLPVGAFARTNVLRSGPYAAIAVLPASHRLEVKRVQGALGRWDLELARELDVALLFPGCHPGAVPPFGHLYGVEVVVDRLLAHHPEVVLPSGGWQELIRIRYADFERLARPLVARIAVPL